MPKRKEHHVVWDKDSNQWQVKRENASRATSCHDTKQQAIDAARQVSRNQETELIIHNQDGRISQADSHGPDLNPPRDRK